MHSQLADLNMKDVESVPFKGTEILAKTEVIDGDTIRAIAFYGDKPIKFSIRICGVDTPESSKRMTKCELEILAGKRVTEIVSCLVPEITKIKIIDSDKYCGRYIGDVYLCNNQWLSKYLIDNSLAVPYNGKKKCVWNDEFLNAILEK